MNIQLSQSGGQIGGIFHYLATKGRIAALAVLFMLPIAMASSAQANPTPAVEPEMNAKDEEYRWLYEKLIPENIRLAQPSESFKTFRVHLQDTYQTFPDPSYLQAQNLKQVSKVQGKITYAGIFKKKYSYDVIQDVTGELILNVRVHLQKAKAQDWIDFQNKMKEAEAFWNQYRPAMDFSYRFRFDIVTVPSDAHYSVQVLDTTRGPYDQFWGRDWTGIVIAHEIGHMMGLGDEYQTISGVTDCYRPSLMCESWGGTLMDLHYYFVLRRLML